MANLPFSKIHGAGNDFVVIDGRKRVSADYSKMAEWICDRHLGIGANGLVVIDGSHKADFRMLFLNPDGSRSVCGNGLRCAARYIFSHGFLSPEIRKFQIETDEAVADVNVIGRGDRIKTELNGPFFTGVRIPTAEPGEHLDRELIVDGRTFNVTAVGMGNPHGIVFVDSSSVGSDGSEVSEGLAELDVAHWGALLAHHSFFPQAANITFVEVINRNEIRVRTFERGVEAETLACGTGICAAVGAAVKTGRCDTAVEVRSKVGQFQITWDQARGRISLTGPTEEVFTGEIPCERFGF